MPRRRHVFEVFSLLYTAHHTTKNIPKIVYGLYFEIVDRLGAVFYTIGSLWEVFTSHVIQIKLWITLT